MSQQPRNPTHENQVQNRSSLPSARRWFARVPFRILGALTVAWVTASCTADCWVIDGVTPRGRYTLWIDPARDYNLARAEVRRKQGDRDRGYLFPKNASEQASVLNVRFERIAGSWVPTESEATHETHHPDGWLPSNTRHRIMEISLQPDHRARDSFALMPVRNGAQVVIAGAAMTPAGRWRDGEILDVQGRQVDISQFGCAPLSVYPKATPASVRPEHQTMVEP